MMLRKISALKEEEKTGDWRKLHNKELHDLDFPPDFIWLIKRRRMKWVRHVARMGRREIYAEFALRKLKMTPL